MTTPPAPHWWQEQHTALEEFVQEGDSGAEPFSAPLLDLLAEVERAFAVTGADTPPWPDPHTGVDGTRRDAAEEEYSRCTDPGKYRILEARAAAWTQVLTSHGWARVEEAADGAALPWHVAPHTSLHSATVLRPHRPGAVPLVLQRTAPADAPGSTDLAPADALLPGLVVGVGEEPVPLEAIPDCGCDACDSGSRDLLEQLDRLVVSVVDGSFEHIIDARGYRSRTSFGAEAGSGEGELPLRITAGPWADDWAPRTLCPPLEPDEDPLAALRRRPWPRRLAEALAAALTGRRARPGRSVRYVALSEDEAAEERPGDI